MSERFSRSLAFFFLFLVVAGPAVGEASDNDRFTDNDIFWYGLAERLEYRAQDGKDGFLWDSQGWVGNDYNRLWLRAEGEATFGEGVEDAEFQALYSRPIARFWDFQAGARYDVTPNPSRTYGVIGVQGLAPYWFEVVAAAFISDQGDITARIEAEYEFLFTQRLILQPRAEMNIAFQDIPELRTGGGFSTLETGLRLRYEIKREIAPYIGIAWNRKLGDTADFARLDGVDVGNLSFLVGLRLWY
ncbi:MAG: copper resistance protein B [Pseudomonadota bacterium]